VFGWRLQAEQRMRAAGKPGMTDEQIADFVSRYMPAYQAYLPGLYARGPTTARAGRTLILEVDHARAPVAAQPAPVL
jgi:D-glycerate 3-kinase